MDLHDEAITLGPYADADVAGLVENGTDPETISCRRALIPQSEAAARRFIERGVRLAEDTPARRVAEKAGFTLVEHLPGIAGSKAVYVRTAA